jgi:hypothetical protein
MSAAETADFVEAVRRDFERRAMPCEIDDGTVRVERGGETHELGLTNLAQLCHSASRRDWAEGVASHFDNIFAAMDAEAELDELARSFESVRALLKVRLYPGAALQGMEPTPPTSWELAEGLTAALVYDLPTSVRTVSSEHFQSWNKGREELLETALANVRADSVESRTMDEGASGSIACYADHFFAASHALMLGERLAPGTSHGAVFAVPNRHTLLYAPIVDLGIVESINKLILTALALFEEGPGSISPWIYWWREGSVTLLPSEVAAESVQFVPPDEFVEVLNALPAA